VGAYQIEILNSGTPEPRVLMLRGVDRDTANACAAAIEAAVHAARSSVALILDFAPGQDLTVQCDGFEGARVAPAPS
jgi:hypothetical protein